MASDSHTRHPAEISAGWRRHRACVDYRVWLLPLPAVGADRWRELVAELSTLGRAEADATGVITIRGPWGFLLVPPRGFPELRLSCYKNLSADQENHLLTSTLAAVQRSVVDEP